MPRSAVMLQRVKFKISRELKGAFKQFGPPPFSILHQNDFYMNQLHADLGIIIPLL